MEELLLVPQTGEPFLQPREIALRLIDAFSYISIHRPGAETETELAKQVAMLKELGASAEQIAALTRDHAPGEVLHVVAFDDRADKTCFIRLVLTPNHGLHIGWESKQHHKSSRKLANRIKRAVGYVYGETQYRHPRFVFQSPLADVKCVADSTARPFGVRIASRCSV